MTTKCILYVRVISNKQIYLTSEWDIDLHRSVNGWMKAR